MKYYAVKRGRNPGIYSRWEDCKEQVHGYSNNSFKSFETYDDAEDFVGQQQVLKERGRPPTCRFWLRGRCRNGDDCEFPHESQSAVQAPVCKYWQRGICKYGDQCRYTHPHSDSGSDSENSDSDSHEESDSENDSYDSDEYEYGMKASDAMLLLSHGVKPWDDDAHEFLEQLKEHGY
jgi:hypothetical protein